jgi:hypothetical protein
MVELFGKKHCYKRQYSKIFLEMCNSYYAFLAIGKKLENAE